MEKLTMAIVLGQAGRQGGDTVWGEPWWYDGVNDELLQQHLHIPNITDQVSTIQGLKSSWGQAFARTHHCLHQ
jgi:hypothetical protein